MFEPGKKIGDYEIIDYLERSKKGIVFRVRNTVEQRFEAMRLLPDSLAADAVELERFVREIKVHARLSHPNIIGFYHATQLEGHPVMTTEVVEGVPLEDRLELGALPVEDAISIARQLLAALGEAHRHGVMHREVTPAHILLTPDGEVKLGGFGLAKAKTDVNLTQPGMVVGSVHYMSPEQVKGAALDTRTDLYSAGVVLYEMLTGRKPFADESHFDVMLAQVQKTAPPLEQFRKGIPEWLSAAVARAMAKDREARFGSADEFLAALASGAEGYRAPVAAPAADSGMDMPRPPLTGPANPVFIPMQVIAPAEPAAGSRFLWLAVALPLLGALLFLMLLMRR